MTSLQKRILFILTLTSLLAPFMSSSITVALPAIGADFHLSAMMLSWVAFSFLLSSAVFLLPLGRIADLYGRRPIFLQGIVVYAAASFLSAFAGSGGWLIAFRVIQGIGSAMIFGTSTAILSGIFSSGSRGKALGITISAVYIGLSAGPFLGGILTQHFGWQSIFVLNAAIASVLFVLSYVILPKEHEERSTQPFDVQGALVYGVTICALMFGITLLPALNGVFLIGTGILGMVVFYFWEFRAPSPILDVRLFRENRVFAFSNLAALLNYSATAATAFLISLYLQLVRGMNPQEAGTILIVQPILQALLSPLAGRLSDRMEPQRVASIGMTLTSIGLALFAFVTRETSQLFIIFGLALLGIGFALFSSPNTNAIMGSVDRRNYGIASSTVATMRLTGQMFSTGIVMLLFALFIGSQPLTPDVGTPFITSMRTGFAAFSLLCLAGIGASLARGKMHS